MTEPAHIAMARFFQDTMGLQVVPLFGLLHGPAGSICRCREGASCANAGKHPRQRFKGMPSKLPSLVDNYAVVLGRFIVVDVDDMETLGRLFDVLGFELPETLTIQTSRGAHLWFEHTEPMATRLGAYPKVDLKSGTGYVVGPLSATASGGTYKIAIGAPIATAPVELVAACGKARTHEVMSNTLPCETSPWALPALVMMGEEIRGSQSRNNDLLRLSCRAIRSGIFDAATIVDVLGSAAMAAGLGEEEVRRTLESAFRSVLSGS